VGAIGALTACSVFREGNGKVPTPRAYPGRRPNASRGSDARRREGKLSQRRTAPGLAARLGSGQQPVRKPGPGRAWWWRQSGVLVWMVWFRAVPWASQVCPFVLDVPTLRGSWQVPGSGLPRIRTKEL